MIAPRELFALFAVFRRAILRFLGALRKSPWHSLDTQQAIDFARSRRVCRYEEGITAACIISALRARFTETIAVRCLAVVATRRLAARRAVHWLRWASTDPAREVRACAESGLCHIQREMDRQRFVLSDALAKTKCPTMQAHLYLRLAEAYWELAYAGLVNGATLTSTLATSCGLAQIACKALPGFAPAEAFQGRMWLQLRESKLAEAAFRRAISAGYPEVKLLGYLAECAFYNRDFAAVRQWLVQLELRAPLHTFPRSVISLWDDAHASPLAAARGRVSAV
ncbi:MAG: hypothetical protein FWD73_07905 [Polyangiaceae bacterium]|nr:hypothetical protein [Polyangiaceae bacterium]